MAIDSLSPRSRRAVLMGTAGAVTALAAPGARTPTTGRSREHEHQLHQRRGQQHGHLRLERRHGSGTGQGIGVNGHSDDSGSTRRGTWATTGTPRRSRSPGQTGTCTRTSVPPSWPSDSRRRRRCSARPPPATRTRPPWRRHCWPSPSAAWLRTACHRRPGPARARRPHLRRPSPGRRRSRTCPTAPAASGWWTSRTRRCRDDRCRRRVPLPRWRCGCRAGRARGGRDPRSGVGRGVGVCVVVRRPRPAAADARVRGPVDPGHGRGFRRPALRSRYGLDALRDALADDSVPLGSSPPLTVSEFAVRTLWRYVTAGDAPGTSPESWSIRGRRLGGVARVSTNRR